MKIGNFATILFKGLADKQRFANTITPGESFSAKIVKKTGRNDAVIEIKGELIRANFKSGVPDSSRVMLRYEGGSGSEIVFKLIKYDKAELASGYLENLLLGKPGTISSYTKHEAVSFLKEHSSSLLALNEALMKKNGYKGRDRKNSGITALLNRLKMSGHSTDSLASLAVLMTGAKPAQLLRLLLNKIRKDDRFKDKGMALDFAISSIDDHVDDLLKTFEQNISDDFLELLAYKFDSGDDIVDELPYYDPETDEFMPVECIFEDDSLIANCEFSEIGGIDIMIKRLSNGIHAFVYSEHDGFIKGFQSMGNDIPVFNVIKSCDVQVHVLDRKKIINKILAIYSHPDLFSKLDIRI